MGLWLQILSVYVIFNSTSSSTDSCTFDIVRTDVTPKAKEVAELRRFVSFWHDHVASIGYAKCSIRNDND